MYFIIIFIVGGKSCYYHGGDVHVGFSSYDRPAASIKICVEQGIDQNISCSEVFVGNVLGYRYVVIVGIQGDQCPDVGIETLGRQLFLISQKSKQIEICEGPGIVSKSSYGQYGLGIVGVLIIGGTNALDALVKVFLYSLNIVRIDFSAVSCLVKDEPIAYLEGGICIAFHELGSLCYQHFIDVLDLFLSDNVSILECYGVEQSRVPSTVIRCLDLDVVYLTICLSHAVAIVDHNSQGFR